MEKTINKIGIVGGGMGALLFMAEAAKKGMATTLLDPRINCLGATYANEHMIAAFTSENIKKLSLRVDAVVFNTLTDCTLKLEAASYPQKDSMGILSSPKKILELVTELEVPYRDTYYQDNKGDTFNRIDEINLPFKLVKEYEDRIETVELFNQSELAEEILEMNEKINSFILQPIRQYSTKIICVGLVDNKNNVVFYNPVEECYDEEGHLMSLTTTTSLSKTMLQKINRYNKKLVKELNSVGLYTICYGVKANKGVEILEITPELPLAANLLEKAYDLSPYEQYIGVLMGMNCIEPTLLRPMQGHLLKGARVKSSKVAYHVYQLENEQLYIVPLKQALEQPTQGSIEQKRDKTKKTTKEM
ncbi:hypothetical protein CS063_05985 [Sporanaerobium hydrogeniformans]|uniref:Uncharacterized protein n=1 Tax=Sporanaerobium hydrogeniformans TaxID=3072179 RepID=A0AC61DD66_9FIRM|nr:hypothetical protein [Sporanaerobium hydrogeniformans]PHV71239.1 hypothetical protein CS063_05985 [Sporanaerobium hydrogeniformans]